MITVKLGYIQMCVQFDSEAWMSPVFSLAITVSSHIKGQGYSILWFCIYSCKHGKTSVINWFDNSKKLWFPGTQQNP